MAPRKVSFKEFEEAKEQLEIPVLLLSDDLVRDMKQLKEEDQCRQQILDGGSGG